MYRCLDCGVKFEEPEIRLEYFEGAIDDMVPICPNVECASDDIEKLHLCRCERDYITDSQDRCAQCETEIAEAMQEARERIKTNCNVDHQVATEDIVWWIEKEG